MNIEVKDKLNFKKILLLMHCIDLCILKDLKKQSFLIDIASKSVISQVNVDLYHQRKLKYLKSKNEHYPDELKNSDKWIFYNREDEEGGNDNDVCLKILVENIFS